MMSASNLILTLLIFQTIFLLEPIVLLLFLWLLTYSLITGTTLEAILPDITLAEDDILLPHPPGFLGTSGYADIGGNTSTCAADLDVSDTSLLDYSISSAIDLEISCTVPAIVVASGTARCLLETSSEHKFDLGPAVEASNVLECSSSSSTTDICQSSGSSKILNINEPISTTAGLQLTTIMCHTEPNGVKASPATSCTQQRSSESEYLAQSIDIPADLDERPVFSRHIVTGNVIFPVRKPPATSQATHDSSDLNSVLKRMPASWVQKRRRDVPRSLRFAMSGVMDSSIFRREQKPGVIAGCDAYDSWPYIRTEIEQDIKNDREKAEEDTFVSVLKWAVTTFRA